MINKIINKLFQLFINYLLFFLLIKISYSTGEKINFKTIADAAKDANISPPALRQRILTKVHTNGYHWIFNKNATHYI